jgi:hypothetical protein
MGVDRWRSSRRGWAITAAVLAAIVCLACWPRPTLGVLGIVVGTGAVLAGLRGLLAEHRRQAPAADTGPDASGRDPETARTHPDASAEQRDDQAGDDPESIRTPAEVLRGRVLAAMNGDVCLCGNDGCSTATALLAAYDAHVNTPALELLYEGEEPYADEALVPTPAQWIWLWNHATPAQRLDTASHIKAMADRLDRVEALARRWQDADPLLPGEALDELRDALSDDAQPVIYQSVQAGDRIIRVRGTRVPTPDERRAIAALLDATDLALGRPAPTEEDVTVFETPITPPLTGPMIPTDTPTCGTNLPATDGIPCAEPAAWHIRWATGDGDRFPAGLACQVHMDALAERHAWHERHPAGPDCGTRTADWTPDRCTPAEEA